MTLKEIPFRPGVWKDDTDQASRGYATDSEKIRWINGRAEALGGWITKLTGIQGKARAGHEFTTIAGMGLVAIATSTKLYLHVGTRLVDITPLRRTAGLAPDPINTQAGTDVVGIIDTAHGAMVGDTVYVRGSAPVNGVQLSGLSGTLTASPFFSTPGTGALKVVHIGHGMVDNDLAFYAGASGFAGIPAGDLNRAQGFRVRVLNVNEYQIEVATPANSSSSGGGTPGYAYAKPYIVAALVAGGNEIVVHAANAASGTGAGGGAGVILYYDISVGRESTRNAPLGYGSGAYGRGLYGRSALGIETEIIQPLRQWSLTNFGEQLIANIVNGPIYYWLGNMSDRAILLPNAPLQCRAVIVTRERYLLACGCTTTDGNFDPMAIRHPDGLDITNWTPAATNNSRSYRLGQGSAIIGVCDRQSGPMIWTDTTPHVSNFVGAFDQIYDFEGVGQACGLAALHAVVERSGTVYWVTPGYQFYSYRGGLPEALPCRLETWFRNRVAKLHTGKMYAFADTAYEAISFLFVAGSAVEANEYTRLDLPEQRRDQNAGWSQGTLDRAISVQGLVFPDKKPLAVSSAGVLYQHETGYGDDLVAVTRRVKFAPVSIEDGDQRSFISRVVVDINLGGVGALMLYGREWPDRVLRTKGPLTVLPERQRIDTRFSCREVGYTFETTDTQYWRMGVLSGDVSLGTRT